MPKNRPRLQQVAPDPEDEEQRPLLDDQHPDHGTLTEQQAAIESRLHDGLDEEGNPIIREPTTLKLLAAIAPLYSLSFFAALDSTIVATLAGRISNEFHSFTLLSWLGSGYLVGNAATQPLSGKLSDIYGRKAGLIFASTFFSIGTLMCAAAPSPSVIIAGRIVAGIGGGCINTMSTFVASDLIPLRRRGTWQGIANLVFGSGMGLGGFFGGLMADTIGWRWAFYIQVPFIVLGGVICFFTINIPIKESATSKIKRVDFLGALTLSTSLVLLVLGLSVGGNLVPWKHPLVIASLPLSVVALMAFVYVEARVASEPIIPVRLLLHRTVASALLASWFITMSVYCSVYYAPIYFTVISHLSTTQTGIRLIPFSAALALGSLGAGLIMRSTGKYYLLTCANLLIFTTANVLMAVFFRQGLPLWPPFLILTLQGLGYGALLTIMLLALLAAVSHAHQAVITSAQYAVRSTGSTIGVVLGSAVFQNILSRALWARFGDVPGAEEIIARLRDDLDEVSRLGPRWRAGVEAAYADALRGVWGVMLALGLVGALALLCVREHRLYSSLDRK